MGLGLLAFSYQETRNSLCNEVKCFPQISDTERQNIVNSLKVQNGISYSFRLSIFPFLFYLYKQKYFERNISFFKREIPLTIGLLMFISFGDCIGSEVLWYQTKNIIEKYKSNKKIKKIKINDQGMIVNNDQNERFYE